MADRPPLLVPVQIDAFRLNEAVCGDGSDKDYGARIAPITQPNYTFLRTDKFMLQNDVLPHVDLHNSAPAARNPRLRDLSKMPTTPLKHRRGIYLHWTLPRCYRSGVAMADSATEARRKDERDRRGLPTGGGTDGGGGAAAPPKVGSSTPGFIQPPTRWLVVRKLDLDTIQPPEAKNAFKNKESVAWVIESDHLWKLDDIPLDYDLQIDVSPFVNSSGGSVDEDQLKQQAEVFIGRRTPLEEWKGSSTETPIDISLIRSSNQLFADFQFHNSNVFSMLDNFCYEGDDHTSQYLSYAKASYYLFGWHRDDAADPLWEASGSLDLGNRMSGLFMAFSGANSADEKTWVEAKKSSRLLCHGAMYDVVWDNSKKPDHVPADDFARRLRDPTEPGKLPAAAMSVGTTPLDALITYCKARKGKSKDSKAIKDLEEDILLIQSLLHARDDGVEGQREAKDTVYNWNFARSGGGLRYFLSSEQEKDRPTVPDPASQGALVEVNRLQSMQSACVRVLQQWRWEMFSRWWKYTSDVANTREDGTKNFNYKEETMKLANRIDALVKLADELQKEVTHKLHPETPISGSAAVAAGRPSTAVVTDGQGGTAGGAEGKDVLVNPLATAKSGTQPFFYRSQDPTVLVGGIDSGWAIDYLDNVKARLPSETFGSAALPDSLQDLLTLMTSSTSKLPTAVFGTAFRSLIAEFWALRPDGGSPDKPPAGKSFPQFHDDLAADMPPESADGTVSPPAPPVPAPPAPAPPSSGSSTADEDSEDSNSDDNNDDDDDDDGNNDEDDGWRQIGVARWRDRWSNRQPWFPLYVEWEAEYTHVPIEYWTLTEQAARLSDSKRVRYGIKPSEDHQPLSKQLEGKLDSYTFSGRSLILPQPSFSLQAKIEQLYSDTPLKIRNKYLKEKEFNKLRQGIKALSYLSAPLSGLTDGLVTLAQGTHIKPENKTLDEQGVANTEAIEAAKFDVAGLSLTNLGKIQGNSALTPFATVTRFPSTEFCPFKPVTHGQFRFRKFNIIDKFGQVLVANDPKPTAIGPPPIYPAISDWYEPQMYDKQTPNTVTRDSDPSKEGTCQFMQMPPSINQNSRLNADFVVKNTPGANVAKPANWRPVSEWESPIWGWVVTNYADYGIQLFLPDGTFYREVRIGGPNDSLVSAKWTPFEPDKSIASVDTAQLDALITKLGQKDYLEAFWYMVTRALDALPPAPTTYAGFLNSIVGKPLALANMGWSLELDGPAFTNQSTNAAKMNPNLKLLPDDPLKPLKNDGNEEDDISYKFQIKLGDKEREYDGLVGYFKLDKGEQGTELDMSTIYTYFSRSDMRSLTAINKDNYPFFRPYYIEPFVTKPNADSKEPEPVTRRDAVDYENARNTALQTCGHVFGALLDPFTAMHAFSSVLPARALKLAPWTWQAAMDKMTAFLHAGPYHITADVPVWKEERRLTTAKMKEVPPVDIAIPALPSGDWNWLQPYCDPPAIANIMDPPSYNSFGLDRRGDLSRPGFQNGPYTAIEGYLQLRNPIMQDKPSQPPQPPQPLPDPPAPAPA